MDNGSRLWTLGSGLLGGILYEDWELMGRSI